MGKGYDTFILSLVSPCPSESVDGFNWPQTQPGETVTLNCPAGQSGQKSRECGPTGIWNTPTGTCSKY